MVKKYSFNKQDIRVLLLEGIHQSAVKYFNDQGYTRVEYYKGALDDQELEEKIKDVHIIGIRSRTSLTEGVLRKAKKLFAIGCFSIGTNQVDLQRSEEHTSEL